MKLESPAIAGVYKLFYAERQARHDWEKLDTKPRPIVGENGGDRVGADAAEFIERMQALIKKDTGNAKDIPRLQPRAPAKPIN